MSTTPVFTALPASNGGIAFGPPMKLICSDALAFGVELLDPRLQALHVDAVLGEGADQPQGGLLGAGRGGEARQQQGRRGPEYT